MHAQARTSTHAHRHSLFDLIWFDSTGPQKLGTVERTNGEHIVADNIQTPLHHAASNGHVELCRFLVENGANVNAACVSTFFSEMGSVHIATIHRILGCKHHFTRQLKDHTLERVNISFLLGLLWTRET
eukprot:c7592_g1_i6.p1 GENE.c7592_g1_i6~~c7592_g1_i6.p1  ORF type:complete len:129 (+),score=18.32 c7592_g1_i6:128-514(+)